MANNEIKDTKKKIENKQTGIYKDPNLSQIELDTDPVFNEDTDLKETNQDLTNKLEAAGLNADYINKKEEAADTKENWFFKMLDYTLLVPLHATEGALEGLLNTIWGNSPEDLWGEDANGDIDGFLNGLFRQIFGSAWKSVKGDELYNNQRLSGANLWAELLTGDPDTTDWNRWGKLAAGLTTDIFLDPLTYTGIPFLSEGIGAVSKKVGDLLEYGTEDYRKFSNALFDALDEDAVSSPLQEEIKEALKPNEKKIDDVVKNNKPLGGINIEDTRTEVEKFLGYNPTNIIKEYAETGTLDKKEVMKLLKSQSLYRVAKRTGLSNDLAGAQSLLDIEKNITDGIESLNRTGRKALNSYALKDAIEESEAYRTVTDTLKDRVIQGGKDGEEAQKVLDDFDKKYTKKVDLKQFSNKRKKEKAKNLFKYGNELTDEQFQKLLNKGGKITRQEFDTIAKQKALWNVLNNKYSVLDRTEAVSNLTKDASGTLSQISWQKLYDAANSTTLLEHAREKLRKNKNKKKSGVVSKETKEKILEDSNISESVKETMKNMNVEDLKELQKRFRPKNFYEWWSSHLTGTQAKKVYRRTRNDINVAKRRATATIAKIMRNASEGNKISVRIVRDLLTSEGAYDEFIHNSWENFKDKKFEDYTVQNATQNAITKESDYSAVLTQILDNVITAEEKNLDIGKAREIVQNSGLLISEDINKFTEMFKQMKQDIIKGNDNILEKRGTTNDLVRNAMITNPGNAFYSGTTKPLNSFLSSQLVKDLKEKVGVSPVNPAQLVAEFWRLPRKEKLASLQNAIRANVGWLVQGTPKVQIGDLIYNFLEDSDYVEGVKNQKAKDMLSTIKKQEDFDKKKLTFEEGFAKNPRLTAAEIRELHQYALDPEGVREAAEALIDSVGVPPDQLGIFAIGKDQSHIEQYMKTLPKGSPITSELRTLIQTMPNKLVPIDVIKLLKNPEQFAELLKIASVTFFTQNKELKDIVGGFLGGMKNSADQIITDTDITSYIDRVASNLLAKREALSPKGVFEEVLDDNKEINKLIQQSVGFSDTLPEKFPDTKKAIDYVTENEDLPKKTSEKEFKTNEERDLERVENQLKSILNVSKPETAKTNWGEFLKKDTAQQLYSLRNNLKRALGLNKGRYGQDLFLADMLQAILKKSTKFTLQDFPKTPSTIKNISTFLSLLDEDIPQQLLLSAENGTRFAKTAMNNIKQYVSELPISERIFPVLDYLERRGEVFSPLENFTKGIKNSTLKEQFPTILTFVTNETESKIRTALNEIRALVPKENLKEYRSLASRTKYPNSPENRLMIPVNYIVNDLNKLGPVFEALQKLDLNPSVFNISRFITDKHWRSFYKLANAKSLDEFSKYFTALDKKLPKRFNWTGKGPAPKILPKEFKNPNLKAPEQATRARTARAGSFINKTKALDLFNKARKGEVPIDEKGFENFQENLRDILKSDWDQTGRAIERQNTFKTNKLIPKNYNLIHTLSKDLNTLASNYSEDLLHESNFRYYFNNIPELNERLKKDNKFLQKVSPKNDLELVFNSNPLAYLVDAIDPEDLTLFKGVLKENISPDDYRNLMDIITSETSLRAVRSLADSFRANEMRKLGIQRVNGANIEDSERVVDELINSEGINALYNLQVARLSDYISTAAPSRAQSKYLARMDEFQSLLAHARAMNDLVSNEFYAALKNNSNEKLNRLRYYTDFLGNPLLDEKKLENYANLNGLKRGDLNLNEIPDIWKYQTKDFLRNMISPNTFKDKEVPYQQAEQKRIGSAPAINERVGKFQIANIGKGNIPQIIPTPLFIESYLERVLDLARHAQGLSKVKNTLTYAIMNGAIRPASSVPNVERDKFKVLRKEDFSQILPRIYTETTGQKADLINAIKELGLPDNSIIEQVEKLSSYFETPDALKQVQSAANFGALEEPLVIQKNVYNTLVRHMINDKDIKRFERAWRNVTNFEKKLILFNPGYVFRVFAGNWMQALLGGLTSTQYWDSFANGVKDLKDLRGLVGDLENIKMELVKRNPSLWSIRDTDAIEQEIYKQLNDLAPKTPEMTELLSNPKKFKYLQKLNRDDIEHNPLLHYLYTTKDELLSQGVLEDQTLKMSRSLPKNSKTASRYNTPSVWRRAIVKDFNKELDPSKMRIPNSILKGTLNLPISSTIFLTDASRLGSYIKVVQEINKAGRGDKKAIKFLQNKFIDLDRTDTAERAAAAWVRDTFFDTLRLSNFEDQYLVNLIPFYRFMRLSIEQNVRELMRGNLVPYEKAWRTFMSFANVADAGSSEYGWNMFPDYILQELYLPVPIPGKEDEYAALKWGFTPSSLLDYIANPNENIFSSLYSTLNPFIKAPIDMATGINSYTGNEYDARFLGPIYNDLVPSGIRNFFTGAGLEDLFRSNYEKTYVPQTEVDNRFLNGLESALTDSLFTTFDTNDQIKWWLKERNAILDNIMTVMESAGYYIPSMDTLFPDIRKYLKYISPSELNYY